MFNIGDTVLYGDKVGVVKDINPIILATHEGTDLTVLSTQGITLISKAEDTIKEYRKRLLCI